VPGCAWTVVGGPNRSPHEAGTTSFAEPEARSLVRAMGDVGASVVVPAWGVPLDSHSMRSFPPVVRGVLPALLLALIVGCSDLGSPVAPRGVLSTPALEFGSVVVGGSVTRTLTVSNTGTGPLNGDASLACEGFAITQGGGAFTVPPGGEHVVEVTFTAPMIGEVSCELALGADLPRVPLTGVGLQQAAGAACAVSVSTLDFGPLAVGTSRLLVFRVRSTGTEPVNLDVLSSCPSFTLQSGAGPRSLAPGDSITVTVEFRPISGGSQQCTIATGPGCPSVTVRGVGTTVSFAASLVPMLASRGCTGCHGYDRTSEIVNVASSRGAPLIKPFDPNGSVIYARIANLGTLGAAMPPGTTGLSAAERQLWRDWILEGAQNN
jgi:Abnormal spindle-like microcephaly-assoc'd, ASPM-SPD-2-Hydin